jgi:hypothetical protein
MKDTVIIEFVNFSVLDTTTHELLQAKADLFISGFLKKEDGFIDAELVKDSDGDARCIIIHYESFEKVKAIVGKLGNCPPFDEFKSVIVPGSISVSFHQKVREW